MTKGVMASEQASDVTRDAHWTARVEFAALYRLAALYGWDDAIFTHISMRVPGPAHHS